MKKTVSVLVDLDIENKSINVLEVISDEDFGKVIERKEYYSKYYDNVQLYSGIDTIEEKEVVKMEKKSFLEKLGQANPWNVFWIMYFSGCIIEVICKTIVALSR